MAWSYKTHSSQEFIRSVQAGDGSVLFWSSLQHFPRSPPKKFCSLVVMLPPENTYAITSRGFPAVKFLNYLHPDVSVNGFHHAQRWERPTSKESNQANCISLFSIVSLVSCPVGMMTFSSWIIMLSDLPHSPILKCSCRAPGWCLFLMVELFNPHYCLLYLLH